MIDNATRDNMVALLKAWLDGGGKSEHATAFIQDVMASKFDIQPVSYPPLDIDKILYKETNGVPHLRGRNERKAVFGLLTKLVENGFRIIDVDDSEDLTQITHQMGDQIKAAMEIIFNLDECVVYVQKEGFKQHYIQLVFGNADDGSEVLADWRYTEGDPDGFDKLVSDYSDTLA